MCKHSKQESCNNLISRWSSSFLNPEPASDVIRLELLGTMSLDDLVNQLSNVINPATGNASNFSPVNISVYAVLE